MAVTKPINQGYTVIMGAGTGTNASRIEVWLEWKESSVSKTNNTSSVTIKLYAALKSGNTSDTRRSSGGKSWITINGTEYAVLTNCAYDFRTPGEVNNFGTKTVEAIPHNSDGSKSIVVGARFTTVSTYISGGTVTNKTIHLTTISQDSPSPSPTPQTEAKVSHIVRLFESNATNFSTNGLGTLSLDVTKRCVVSETLNGEYELEMEYPITGRNYDLIEFRRIIYVSPNPYSDPQPFRIYAISKPINGMVTINAEHISYDLTGYPVTPFSANNVVTAFVNLKNASVLSCPFTFETDKVTTANIKITKPCSIRSVLGGMEGSILDTYRGEYEFDKFNVIFRNHRGSNKGVSIRYGKNLTDLKQEEICSNVYTAVYPYWYSEEDGLVELDNKLLPVSGTYNYSRVLTLDLSGSFDEKPTKANLKSAAQLYIDNNNIGVPDVSLTVSFVQLMGTNEYEDYSLLEEVRLGDTVNVDFPKLRVSALSKCTSTKYNVITGRYDSIELGSSKSTLYTSISGQNNKINKTINELAAMTYNVDDKINRLNTDVDNNYQSINDLESVNISQQSDLTTSLDEIRASITRIDAAVNGLQTQVVNNTTTIQQTSDYIELTASKVSVLESGQNELIDKIETNFDFTTDGLYIGKNTSPIRTLYDNDGMSIKETDSDWLLAEFDSSHASINNVETRSLTLYNRVLNTDTIFGPYVFEVGPSGLSIKLRG